MFNCSNRMLLLIVSTLLTLSISSLAISSRTYGPSNSYRVCQKVSWVFDQISQNVSDPQLTNSFVKFCQNDDSGANKETCQYIANYLLPVYNEIRKDDFCVNLHMNNHDSVQEIKDNSNCDDCILLIEEIKIALTNQEIDNTIKQKLITFCTNLPSFDTECESFVNKEFSNIVLWIQSVNPSHLCKQIHQCDSNSASNPSVPKAALLNLREPAKPKPKLTQSLVLKPAYSNALGLPVTLRCEVCDEVTKWALKILSENQTETAIANAFDSLCSTFYKHNGPKQAHCNHLVDQYTAQLINFIVEDVKPDAICHLFNFCPSSSAVQITFSQYTPSEMKQQTGLSLRNRKVKGPSCLLCVELFRYVYKRVNANYTEAAIESVLDEACEFLYKVSHSQNKLNSCKKFVAANAKTMVQLIKSNAGPTLTCLALGACSTPANTKIEILLREPSKPKTIIAPKQSQFASICNKMVNDRLFQLMRLPTNSNENLIHLVDACKQQESEQDKVNCNVFVYKQQQALQKAFAQAESHDQVCSLAEQFDKSVSVSSETAGSCDLCKLVVGIFYKDLKENKTEAEIINFLIKVCERLSPSDEKPNCKTKVPAYVQELITIIENSTNPAEACALLGYCGKKSSFSSKMMSELSKFLTKATIPRIGAIRQTPLKDKSIGSNPSPACQQCINFVTPIHKWLANKSCETELLDDVSKLCAKCPATDKCTQLLQSHIEAYFDAVDKYSDPTLVCHHIGVCSQARSTSRINNHLVLNRIKPSPQTTSVANQQSVSVKPTSFSSELCYECQLITQFAQTVLLNASIESMIITDVKSVLCNPIHSRIERKVCDDFVDKDGPLIIQHLANTVFDFKRVCQQQLHVCPKSDSSNFRSPARQEDHHHRRRLVGANKCTYGPSYWCQNEQTAAECKVTEYCAKKVWKTNN